MIMPDRYNSVGKEVKQIMNKSVLNLEHDLLFWGIKDRDLIYSVPFERS